MNLTTVLSRLAENNIKLWAEGEQLRVQAPKGVMTPDLRELIVANKAALLAWLQMGEDEANLALPQIMLQPATRHQPFPLTDIQHAYWIGRSGALALGNVSAHGYMEFDYTHLDLERLTAALNQVIARHEMLRAIALPTGEQQILAVTQPYVIPVLDLRDFSEAAQTEQLAAVREELSHQVLPTDQSPLFDIRVTRLSDSRILLHISIDLLMFDLASLSIIFSEWRAFHENPKVVFAPLELSFRDYVLAEQGLKSTALYAKARDYWLNRIDNLAAAPELPVALTSAATAPQIFRRRLYQLDAATWHALKSKAQQTSITPSVLLLTAFAAVLKNWCKQPHFTLNLTLFNRLPFHSQVNQIVGDFTSLTLVDVDYRMTVTFAEQCKRVQRQLWEALDNRYFSGVEVMREIGRRQHNPQAGLMPVVFTSSVGIGHGIGKSFFHLFDGELRYGITQTPQVWLDHQVFEDQGGLTFNWDAVEANFPSGMLDDMFASYCNLLERLAVDEAWWNDAQLSLLPATQLAQRTAVNATDAPLSDELLPTRFVQQAQAHPTAPAVMSVDRTLSYQELYQRANQVGHWLRERGVKPNTLVAVVMEKGWEQVVAVLGIHLAGGAYLPIDPELPTERQHYLLEEGEASIALTQQHLAERLVWSPTTQRLAVDILPLDEQFLPLELVQQPTDLAYVIYTSGSTGLPKGVMIDHRGAVNTVLDINRRFGVTSHDRVLALSALNFDLSVYDIFGLLAVGGTIVLPAADRRTDPSHWFDLMQRHQITLWDTVPALMQMLVDYAEPMRGQSGKNIAKHPVGNGHAVEDDLPSALRLVMLSGDWVPVTLPDRIRALWQQAAIYSLGGATEASIWSIYYPIEKVDSALPSIPYGKPLTNQTFYVLDNHLNPRPIWVPGDLYIGGIGLALGYWKDETKTNARFIIHPRSGERLYKTGDLGRYLPDGNIEFLGREDFQVKIRGHRIELGEIESSLLQHPEIKEAVVAAVGDPKGNRQLVAYVVRDNSHSISFAQVPDRYGDDGQTPAAAIITDSVARLEFRLRQPGIRTFVDAANNIPLTPIDFDAARRDAWLSRQSYRTFLAEPIPFAAFSELLSCLAQMTLTDVPLPKYRYASAGHLYPVQTYLLIKPGRVEGLEGGLYYYQPQQHCLLALSLRDASRSSNETSTSLHCAAENQPIWEQAAFALLLVADMSAIAPMYGELARDFALLEGGYMSQLLMTEAPRHLIGLCPIGGGVDVSIFQSALMLGDNHFILPNILFGGRIDPIQRTRWIQATPREQVAADAHAWQTQLQHFLQQKLPAYMVPTTYVALDALPLGANGKVDRKALPIPNLGAPSENLIAPETDLEKAISAVLQEMLAIAEIGVEHEFADLGLSSVHIVQFNNRLKERLNRQIPIAAVFHNSTVRRLAQHLAHDDGQTDAHAQDKIAVKTRGEQRAQARLAGRQHQRR